MIPLLIGLVGLFAARRALRDGAELHAVRWVAVIGALTLLQIWLGRDDLARYRVSLLGLRHAVAAESGAPRDVAILVSGDYDEADLYVPGAGGGDVARLIPGGDSLLTHVSAVPADDAGAVFAVEQRRSLGRRSWRLLGASPLHAGDTIALRGGGRVYRLLVGTVPDTLHIAGLGIPLPWTRRHVISEAAGGRVVLPSARGQWFRRLRGAQPSVFARAYPLADVVHGVDTLATSLPPLGSFLFYDGRGLALADLDGEVDAPRAAEALTVWSRADGGARAMVAALPLRDYPEIDLTVPERYGIRPLRTLRFEVRGRSLDALLAAPEIQAFDLAALATLRLPPDESGTPAYRVRVSHARNSMVREAIVFESPPRSFAAGSQAILALPEDPKAGSFDVVTPSGTARWATGRPMPLGTDDRALLVRVDGQATSAGFWLVHAVLFAAVGLMLHARRPRGAALALAVAAVGILAVRLLLGIGALLEFPFVGEGHQLSLWLLPVVPWAIVIAAEAGARLRREAPDAGGWRFHTVYALGVVALSLTLFPDSNAKQLVLSLVPIALVAALMLARLARVEPVIMRVRRIRLPDRALSGIALGAALLAARMLLDVIGWREGVRIGGTRIAVSVVYLPAALALLAWLAWRWDHRVRADAGNPARAARTAMRALLSLGMFLLLGFVAVAVWISDFGIVLVGLPGIFLVLAALGVRWVPAGVHGRLIALAYALPLVLFVLLQISPALLVPAAADVGRADVRMSEWNRNELLLLERGDPQSLRLIGQRRSEALAVMRETMRSYTRGNWLGNGFLGGRVSHEIQDTATREHAVSALLASQWGLAGTLGLTVLLLCVLMPARAEIDPGDGTRARRTLRDAVLLLAVLVLASVVLPSPFDTVLVLLASLALLGAALYPAAVPAGATEALEAEEAAAASPPALRLGPLVGALALAVFACSSLYMVLANYGLVFFTGKNVYLLGLDSVSDALEALVLLALGAAGWAAAAARTSPALTRGARPIPLPRRPERMLQRGHPVPTP